MNDNAKQLVAALRSGEYAQGRSNLRRNDDTYCCLGVACDLYHKATGDGQWRYIGVWEFVCGEEGHISFLPERVMDWLGFVNYGGAWQYRPSRDLTFNSLAAANDSGASFERIAEIIESEPEGLFKRKGGNSERQRP